MLHAAVGQWIKDQQQGGQRTPCGGQIAHEQSQSEERLPGLHGIGLRIVSVGRQQPKDEGAAKCTAELLGH